MSRRVVLGIAALYYAVFIARTAFIFDGRVVFTLFDEAMISMRYARHLAEGHGPVWNVGGPAVEGYTNPLWMLVMAGIHASGADDFTAPLCVALVGAVLLAVAALLAARVASTLAPFDTAALPALAFAAVDSSMVFWSLRGMEVPFLAVCITAMVLVALRHMNEPSLGRVFVMCACAAIAMLTRRDAVVAVIVCAGYLFLATAGPWRWRAVVGLLATIAVVQAAHMAVSSWYFGDPWPNTYYLKLEGVSLRTRLARGVPAAALVVVRHVGPLLLVAAALWRSQVRRRVALPLLVGGGQLAYSAYVGGDAWEYMGYANRYIAIAVPLLCAAAAVALVELAGDVRRAQRAAWGLAAIAVARVAADAVLIGYGRGIDRVASDAVLVGLPAAAAVAAVIVATRVGKGARRGLAWQRVATLLAIQLWIVGSGAATASWALNNASSAKDDMRYAQAGLAVRRHTSDAAVIAVTMAGSIPYFSHRAAIDILGKSDPVIARMPPVQAFHPGHNKWNLTHSIAGPRPDLIWGLPRRPGQVAYLVNLGYEPWPGSVFARRDSPRLDRAALSAALHRLYPDIPPRHE